MSENEIVNELFYRSLERMVGRGEEVKKASIIST